MKAEIKSGNLVITIPLETEERESKSGKTIVVATTGGNKETDLKVKGKPVVIGLTAYIKK